MTARKVVRDAARTALAAAPEFANYTLKLSWAHGVDTSDLPAWGVMTPDEQVTPETQASQRRAIDLTVVVKRPGGDDLDDLMDADAVVIERVVPAAVMASTARYSETARISSRISAEGAKRIGTLMVTFRCEAETDYPT